MLKSAPKVRKPLASHSHWVASFSQRATASANTRPTVLTLHNLADFLDEQRQGWSSVGRSNNSAAQYRKCLAYRWLTVNLQKKLGSMHDMKATICRSPPNKSRNSIETSPLHVCLDRFGYLIRAGQAATIGTVQQHDSSPVCVSGRTACRTTPFELSRRLRGYG